MFIEHLGLTSTPFLLSNFNLFDFENTP